MSWGSWYDGWIVDLTEWKRVGSLTAGKEPDGMGWSKADVKK